MNPSIIKKLDTKRTAEASLCVGYVFDPKPETSRAIKKIREIDSYITEGTPLRNGTVTALSSRLGGQWVSVAAHSHLKDSQAKVRAFIRFVTQSFLTTQLSIERMNAGKQVNAPISFANLSHLLAQLHSLSWHQEAMWLAQTVWHNPLNTIGAGYPPEQFDVEKNQLFGWFMSYFTLGSRDIIAASGVTEPDNPDTPFSHLLGRWRDTDAGGLTNLMTAYAEQNMARSMMSFANAPADSLEKLWWYVPYDIYAIQQRRMSEGLDPIPLNDPRLDIDVADLADAPLIQDDLIWPAYLRACAEDGITPYEPRKAVQAVTDRTTLELTLM